MYVTLIMIGINIIIFLLVKLLDIQLLAYYLVPAYILSHYARYILTLFTSIFIHIDYLHIIFNSTALFFLGRIIEPFINSKRFLLIYISSGITGGISHTLYTFIIDGENIYTPVIGASGSISGIIGIAAAAGDRLALFWLLTQIPLAIFSGIESIAFFAHIGGFITGYSIGKLIKISKYERYSF
ncbi:MAG: rhomboid family intramembrane serine protease [Candidatus Nitrosocaldaceae archaeon]